MAVGVHFGALGHFLVVLDTDTSGAGNGTPEGNKWDSHPGGRTVSLASQMPVCKAMGSNIPSKWRVNLFF